MKSDLCIQELLGERNLAGYYTRELHFLQSHVSPALLSSQTRLQAALSCLLYLAFICLYFVLVVFYIFSKVDEIATFAVIDYIEQMFII